MSSAAELPPADYEPRDASPGRILLVAAGIAAGIALALAISAALYTFPASHADTGRQTSFQGSAHAQTNIAADWSRQDAAVQEHLHTYGWTDRPARIVRIPIDRAMDLLANEAAQPKAAATK